MAWTTNARSYLDPSIEWVPEPPFDILKVHLPDGFRKDELKVQLTSANYLKISGTRQQAENICDRFTKEILIPSTYDTNEMSAKFEKGTLHVKIKYKKSTVQESPSKLSKPTMEQSTKPPNPPQETPKHAKEKPPKTKEKLKSTNGEPPKTSSKPEKITNEESTKPETSKPQETPKSTKQEPSELDKARTGKEKKEEVVVIRKVTNKGATSEQENAGKIEEAEALPVINESGSCKFVMENDKDSIIRGLIEELKNERNATNIVLAILFCAVLGLSIKNAVCCFTKLEN